MYSFLPSAVDDEEDVEALTPLFADEARFEPFFLGILSLKCYRFKTH